MNSRIDLVQHLGASQELNLNLAPQLLQWLRILQLPATELSAIVSHELETNPALEADFDTAQPESADDSSIDTEASADPLDEPTHDREALDDRLQSLADIEEDWRDGSTGLSADVSAVESEEQGHRHLMDSIRTRTSLQEHLLKQLAYQGFCTEDRLLAEWIIGSIDTRGYLTASDAELAAMTGVAAEKVGSVVSHIQRFDPLGVGARTLQECLLLQMQHLNGSHETAKRIVRDFLIPAAQKNYALIARELNVDEERARSAVEYLASLNPSPGSAFEGDPVPCVIPDVVVTRRNGSYEVELTDDHIPRLRISGSCRLLLKQKSLSGGDLSYLRNKIRQATFLIDGIDQRKETLLKVAQQIVRIQSEYFDRFDGELQPLTMGRIARVIGVHETTVGRAVADKYMRTPRGVFEMRHFFRKGYRCRDGSGLTPESLKELITAMFDAEAPSAPLADLQVVRMLKKDRGLHMARRTVAKYREELGIPSSKERIRSAYGQAAGGRRKACVPQFSLSVERKTA